MNLSTTETQAIAKFPPALQELVREEIVAGNRIVSISSCFPAPPAGECIKLERTVTTRPRKTEGSLVFRERIHPEYSGEFTDSQRFYFVLEPPLPPPPEPDMNALRAEREARQRAADAKLIANADREARQRRARSHTLRIPRHDPDPLLSPSEVSPLVKRFLKSMEMNYDKWHDGDGYDLKALQSATPKEREQIENLLISRNIKDWRDVEALAALNSPRAQQVLRRAFTAADDRLKIALLSHAPKLFKESQHTKAIVSAIENTEVYGGLTQALLLTESWHPKPIIEALLRGVLMRDGATAGIFAAQLLYLHGKAKSSYDMEQRPFFLKFQDSDRVTLFRELCDRIGIPTATQRRLLSGLHK